MSLRAHPRSRALLVPATLLALVAGPALAATTAAATAATAASRPSTVDPGLHRTGHGLVKVVVSGSSQSRVRAAVLAAGGTHLRPLGIVHGVAATVRADHVDALGRAAGVTAVTADRVISLAGTSWDAGISASPYAWTSQAAPTWSQAGTRGAGVGIAVLDTGVSSVGDLAGRLMQGPDFSGEGQNTVDSFGHGTVMAGIAAGSGAAAGNKPLTGVAPDATIIAVKAAGRNGATDVSTILTALTWVGAFKDTYNIRVLNLSWGVPSTQDPLIDPLNFAVERLWSSGITVVAAAGNSGPNPGTIIKPGDDPLVLTVGAYDDQADSNAGNDTVPAWSSQGPTAQGRMKPDLVAPGRTLVATRSPGSAIVQQNPGALVGSAYIKGSGTSEATAVTSGAAALLLAAHPSWTPDQVKYALTSTASRISGVATTLQGAGRLQIKSASNAYVGLVLPQLPIATGTGSLQASRGSAALLSSSCGGVTWLLNDDSSAWCGEWAGSAWTGSAWTGSAWTGSAWTGSAWTGAAWTGSAWTSAAWTGSAWTGSAWTGSAWTGSAWTGSAWTGSAWTGSAWTGSAWTGSAWTGSAWTSNDYGNDTQPSPADGTAGTSYQGGFLTAFYGDHPAYGRKIVGEISNALPVTLPGLG
jgi:serine protease AprX